MNDPDPEVMQGVREYGEEKPVKLQLTVPGRPCIIATNEGGYNSTAVDLLDVLAWAAQNPKHVCDALAPLTREQRFSFLVSLGDAYCLNCGTKMTDIPGCMCE